MPAMLNQVFSKIISFPRLLWTWFMAPFRMVAIVVTRSVQFFQRLPSKVDVARLWAADLISRVPSCKDWQLWATILSVIALIFAALAFWTSLDASRIAKWTAHKDFVLLCADESLHHLSNQCPDITKITMPAPPGFDEKFTRRDSISDLMGMEIGSEITYSNDTAQTRCSSWDLDFSTRSVKCVPVPGVKFESLTEPPKSPMELPESLIGTTESRLEWNIYDIISICIQFSAALTYLLPPLYFLAWGEGSTTVTLNLHELMGLRATISLDPFKAVYKLRVIQAEHLESSIGRVRVIQVVCFCLYWYFRVDDASLVGTTTKIMSAQNLKTPKLMFWVVALMCSQANIFKHLSVLLRYFFWPILRQFAQKACIYALYPPLYASKTPTEVEIRIREAIYLLKTPVFNFLLACPTSSPALTSPVTAVFWMTYLSLDDQHTEFTEWRIDKLREKFNHGVVCSVCNLIDEEFRFRVLDWVTRERAQDEDGEARKSWICRHCESATEDKHSGSPAMDVQVNGAVYPWRGLVEKLRRLKAHEAVPKLQEMLSMRDKELVRKEKKKFEKKSEKRIDKRG